MHAMQQLQARRYALGLALIVGALAAWTCPAHAAGALASDPAYVTITKPDQSFTVKLTLDGKPLPAAAIKGAKYMASEHDYARMFSLAKKDGEVTVTPTKLLEVGSYTLVLTTTHGPVNVEILAPLTDLPDTIEKQAAAMGISVDELKTKMGLTHKMAREQLALTLPPSYVEGQTLVVTVDANPKRVFTWSVNDKVVKQGAGENTLTYVFEKPGKYTVAISEKEGDTVVATTTAATEVTAAKPIPWDVTVATTAEVTGPKGYKQYTWSLNGKKVSDGPSFKHTFSTAGKYTVECHAEDPEDKKLSQSVNVRYDVTVSPAAK
jgi:hypothetical protein